VKRQLYYEDVVVGGEIMPLIKRPTTRQLVMYAGASGDYNPIHYDKDYAVERGLSGVVVHGQLAGCFLGQMLTDWMGDEGRLRKLTLSYKGMNFPDDTLTCRGIINKKDMKDGQYLVTANIWIEKEYGEKTLTGMAVVALPTCRR
jgi:acyl dehydratase